MKVKIKQVTVIKMGYFGNYLALYAFSNKKEAQKIFYSKGYHYSSSNKHYYNDKTRTILFFEKPSDEMKLL